MKNFRVIWVVGKRSWLKGFRRPVTVSFGLVQPLMWMLFFGFLFFRFPIEQLSADISYLDFLTPGIVVMTIVFGTFKTGVELLKDMQSGFFERVYCGPVKPSIVILGKLGADVLRTVSQSLLVLLIGILLGAKLDFVLLPWIVALSALILLSLIISSLSNLIALLTKTPEVMATAINVINMPLIFTSSILVPAKQMPEWLATLSQYNPLTIAANICREAMLRGELEINFSLLFLFFGFVIIIATLFGVLSRANNSFS